MVRYRVMAFLLILILVSSIAVQASPSQKVYDLADLLTDVEINDLEEIARAFISKHNMDIIFLTTTDRGGLDPWDYSIKFFEDGGFGIGPDFDGVILLVDIVERDLFVTTSGEMIRYLTDARINVVLDRMFDFAANGDFHGVFVAGTRQIDTYITEGIPSDQYSRDESLPDIVPQRQRNGFTPAVGLVGLGSGLIIALIVTGLVNSKYKKDFLDVAYDYRAKTNLNLTLKNDTLTNKFVTTRRIQTQSTSSGSSSSGRSTTRTSSSSGRSYGGGGRKF